MKLTKLASVLLLTSSLFTASASAQYSGGSVNFGGGYSKTTVTGPNGRSGSITNTSFGGGINMFGGNGGGYGYGGGGYGGYGGGYGGCGGYGGGGGYPVVLPYYGGCCAPVYVPYSPFTNCYAVPYYPPVFVPCGGFLVR